MENLKALSYLQLKEIAFTSFTDPCEGLRVK